METRTFPPIPRLSVPWTRTETAKRAFCVAAPNDIRNASSLSSFRAKLKTHFILLHTRDDIGLPTAAPRY